MSVICFGAGMIGKRAYYRYRNSIVAFVDNDIRKQGKKLFDIPIISWDEYIKKYKEKKYELILTCGVNAKKWFYEQLYRENIDDVSAFEDGEPLVSFCSDNREDIILYHVLKDEDDFFYIDIGSNDPIIHSVTKMLYDLKHARGINIDPIPELINKTKDIRPEDISICACVGEKEGIGEIYYQGERTSFVSENTAYYYNEPTNSLQMDIVTLKKICYDNVCGRTISFLKIDVEGFEKEVLLGADFNLYRPWIIIIEYTEPGTRIDKSGDWKHILKNNNYHLAYTYGVNQYYVADEKEELDNKFITMDELFSIYHIYEVVQSDI